MAVLLPGSWILKTILFPLPNASTLENQTTFLPIHMLLVSSVGFRCLCIRSFSIAFLCKHVPKGGGIGVGMWWIKMAPSADLTAWNLNCFFTQLFEPLEPIYHLVCFSLFPGAPQRRVRKWPRVTLPSLIAPCRACSWLSEVGWG